MRLEMNDYDPKVQTPRETRVRFQDYKGTGAAVVDAAEQLTQAAIVGQKLVEKKRQAAEELEATKLLHDTELGIEEEMDALRRQGVDAETFNTQSRELIKRRLTGAEEAGKVFVDKEVQSYYGRGLSRVGLSRITRAGDEYDQRFMDEGRAKFVTNLEREKQLAVTAPGYDVDPDQSEYRARVAFATDTIERQRNRFLTNQEADAQLIKVTDDLANQRLREVIRQDPVGWSKVLDDRAHPAYDIYSEMWNSRSLEERAELKEYSRLKVRQEDAEADRKRQEDERALKRQQDISLNVLYLKALGGEDITEDVRGEYFTEFTAGQRDWLLTQQSQMRQRKDAPSDLRVQSRLAVIAATGIDPDDDSVQYLDRSEFRAEVSAEVASGQLNPKDAGALLITHHNYLETRAGKKATVRDKQIKEGEDQLKDELKLFGAPTLGELFAGKVDPRRIASIQAAKNLAVHEYHRRLTADLAADPMELAEEISRRTFTTHQRLLNLSTRELLQSLGISTDKGQIAAERELIRMRKDGAIEEWRFKEIARLMRMLPWEQHRPVGESEDDAEKPGPPPVGPRAPWDKPRKPTDSDIRK